jgi:hypothetical protein
LDYIEEQINVLIKAKYNFISYNALPDVGSFDFEKNSGKVIDKEKPTARDEMVLKFAEKYKENYESHGIRSPFKNNVIIIDEVHGFVREIINGSVGGNIFYDWIVDGEDIKIVFLSGTPVMNKPAEIAILFNMLRGSLLIFDFSVKSDKDEVSLLKELRDYFYTENSSIEQLHTSKKKGKIIISFTKTKTNFESIMDDDVIKTIKYNNHDLDAFFNEIYDGLYKFFDKKDVIPEKSELLSKSPYKEIKLGKKIVFDEDTQIPFNRKQNLFEIVEDDVKYDLSDNDTFMNYFFDDSFNISPKKKVLLRRMLMGLTSYYPIDRSSIINMPQIVPPRVGIVPRYKDYKIIDNTNIVLCPMSPQQWAKYEDEAKKSKQKMLNANRRRNLYNEDPSSDFNIRTRQACNMVYDDDSFRTVRGDEKEKEKMKLQTYKRMRANGNFSFDGELKLYSPKFFKILENINRFVDGGNPTGKALYYSDMLEVGSDVFEQILEQNGYEKYDHNKKDIDTLVSEGSKKKRYTRITGKEDEDMKRNNKEAFNHDENVRGEYIQIIMISAAGAEGIDLKCVRQVHIMEPYWNYVRINQVFGRAIRMNSHANVNLPKDERNVEQYIYMATLPDGGTFKEVFDTLKREKWPEVEEIEYDENIKERYKPLSKTIKDILDMRKNTQDRTQDQIIFDIMETKYKISNILTSIIQESSVDCIQNSRDDIQLNNKCLRFSSKLNNEDSHFPGINANEQNKIDVKQFKSNFIQHIKPNIYVILAKKKENNTDLYIYYELDIDEKNDKFDVRYVRENGIQVCDYEPEPNNFFTYYESKDHPLNADLGEMFSVFKTIYKTPKSILSNIRVLKFPSIKSFKGDRNIIGHIIKYNITEKLYFSPRSDSKVKKLFEFKGYKDNGYDINGLEFVMVRNGRLFKSID